MSSNSMPQLTPVTVAARFTQLDSGQVVGIINKVFIQETKETVLQKPSGISYAIPINHLQELLKKIRPE